MARFEVPMTLKVEADSVEEASLIGAMFEKVRVDFDADSPLRWLQVGLTQQIIENDCRITMRTSSNPAATTQGGRENGV